MAKKVMSPVKPVSLSLPKELGNTTLNELLNDKNTEFTKKGSKISFRKSTDFGVATLEIETYDTGRKTIYQSIVPKRAKKADYIDDIIQMKKSGIKQKDIALHLGMSEPYVTKLLKDYKK